HGVGNDVVAEIGAVAGVVGQQRLTAELPGISSCILAEVAAGTTEAGAGQVGCGHGIAGRGADLLALGLVVSEEEGLVLDRRAADGAANAVLQAGGNAVRLRVRVARLVGVPGAEVVGTAMGAVGAR